MELQLENKKSKICPLSFGLNKKLSQAQLDKRLRGAASWQRIKRVEDLIKSGADISSTINSRKQENVFHKVSRHNYQSDVTLLLLKELDSNEKYKGREKDILTAKNKYGETPVEQAICYSKNNVAKTLLQSKHVDFKESYLHDALKSGNSKISIYLLQKNKKDLLNADSKVLFDKLIANTKTLKKVLTSGIESRPVPVHNYGFEELKNMTKGIIDVSNTEDIKYALNKLRKSSITNVFDEVMKDLLIDEITKRAK